MAPNEWAGPLQPPERRSRSVLPPARVCIFLPTFHTLKIDCLDRTFRSIFVLRKIDRKDRSRKRALDVEKKILPARGTSRRPLGSARMNVAVAAPSFRISTCRQSVKDVHDCYASFIGWWQVEILKAGAVAAAAALAGPKIICAKSARNLRGAPRGFAQIILISRRFLNNLRESALREMK